MAPLEWLLCKQKWEEKEKHWWSSLSIYLCITYSFNKLHSNILEFSSITILSFCFIRQSATPSTKRAPLPMQSSMNAAMSQLIACSLCVREEWSRESGPPLQHPLNWIECHHHQKSSQKNKASCYVRESQETIKVTQVNQDSCTLSVCHSAFMIQESLQFKPNFYPTPRPQRVAPPKASPLIRQRVLAWGS